MSTIRAVGCTNCTNTKAVAKGLCGTCYARTVRGKPLSDPPRIPAGEGDQLAIRCSKTQRRAWTRAARAAGVPFRDWMRLALDKAAQISPFHTWLCSQAHRDDDIGTLAYDVAGDHKWPLAWEHSLADLKRHVGRDAAPALEAAWKEFRALKS